MASIAPFDYDSDEYDESDEDAGDEQFGSLPPAALVSDADASDDNDPPPPPPSRSSRAALPGRGPPRAHRRLSSRLQSEGDALTAELQALAETMTDRRRLAGEALRRARGPHERADELIPASASRLDEAEAGFGERAQELRSLQRKATREVRRFRDATTAYRAQHGQGEALSVALRGAWRTADATLQRAEKLFERPFAGGAALKMLRSTRDELDARVGALETATADAHPADRAVLDETGAAVRRARLLLDDTGGRHPGPAGARAAPRRRGAQRADARGEPRVRRGRDRRARRVGAGAGDPGAAGGGRGGLGRAKSQAGAAPPAARVGA